MKFDFARLIQPVTTQTFKRRYWESELLVVKRNDPSFYRELLSLGDVDSILSQSRVRPPDIRVLREGDEIPLSKVSAGWLGSQGMLEHVYAQYRDGYTIVLQFLHERWKPLMRLCQSLSEEFSAAFQVNVYLTPAGGKGLLAHYDTHDVFVLQTEGIKRWRVYRGPIALPLRRQPFQRGSMEPGELIEEFQLRAGDLAYIPRGFIHEAAAEESTSLHLTVGIHPITWASLLVEKVGSVMEKDPRFRKSVPLGFAVQDSQRRLAEARLADLLEALWTELQPTPMIDQALETASCVRQPSLEGHLLDLAAVEQVGLETKVRPRSEIGWRLWTDEEHAYLRFHGKVVRLPAYVEPDLRFAAESNAFSADSLPGDLDEAGRLVLIRRLIKEGFLTMCRPGAT